MEHSFRIKKTLLPVIKNFLDQTLIFKQYLNNDVKL